MKKYVVYLECGEDDITKVVVPAESKKKAEKFCEGNGTVITVKDVTEKYPIFADSVVTALQNAGFSEVECDIIARTLQITGIAE